MLSRKRRASSISSKQDEDPLQMDDSTPEQSPVQSTTTTARKKRRPDPFELCQHLYDSIRNIKKEDGAMVCDVFIRAPKRRQEPSYYDVVTNPIDLLKIQQKLKTDSYDDIDDLMQDFELLINNAKAFYKTDSTEYQDAMTLWQHILTNKQKILESAGIVDEEPKVKRTSRTARRLTASHDNDSEATRSPEEDINPYEELFASIMSAVDSTMNDRPLHRMFLLLPSKKVYPDYYDVIEHPIDLRLIATKIQMNAYSNIIEMERDLLQMTKNACQFNEPGSQIYKDAKTLKRIFTQKRLEIDSGKAKATRRARGLSSAAISTLKEEVDSSDDDETSKKGEGPMWALFDHLYNAAGTAEHPGAIGPPLGTSLWKLPVRRFHPEYFELIKRPISMCQIQTKLNKGDYANISDLTADLYQMLDNAKKAFPPTHRTHKDAVKMLKIMNAKLIEDTLDQETTTTDVEDELDDAFSSNIVPREKKKVGRPRINSNSSTPAAAAAAATTTTTPSSSNTANSPKSNRISINATIKKKILSIQKYLADYSVGNRRVIELFMEKPARKIYPDYYDVIQNPIDMNTIEHNVRADKYATVEDVVADYMLMFANCRQYNEEGSSIYEDANILERALNEKLKEFPGLADIKRPLQKLPKVSAKKKIGLVDKLWQFYETIRDYQEPKGKRQLSLIFTKLPSKNEYPDYYDIIKEPIDMERIGHKLKQNVYETIDDLAVDFLLMLENACKYNEPDSQIYKDALVLQQLTLQMKQTLRRERESIPDVPLAVQELLLTLFTAIYNHQDEEGRCFSDSLAELPEHDELIDESSGNTSKLRGISLDLIKRRLDKGVYKRLDQFQEDIFACLERARKLSRTDSDIFQDSIELQSFFIKKRNELCKDTLSSPALSYTLEKLFTEVELVRTQKLIQEEDQEDKEEVDTTAAMHGESMTINQNVFSPGDFVYFQLPDNKIPSIAYIERLWTTEENIQMMYGAIFLRPHETYHVTTRKFLEKEVFKGSIAKQIPMDKVLGKCCIMNIKDYIKLKPEGFAEKDVYVCESRYNVRGRCFKKFKHWPFVRENDPVKFIQRDEPLELKRVMSVFKERIEKHKGELEELKLQEALVEKEKPNVQCEPPANGEPNSCYYQQYNTICSGVVKTGDFVYVATQTGKQSIAQIQQIWENANKSYFKGPWLLTPSEILATQTVGKQFYRQELLLSTVEEISPIIAIVGRCAVLEYNDYISSRPTEFPESDVFICESIYDELKRSLRKLNTGAGSMRRFQHTPDVTQDEIYYFKSTIKPAKDTKGAEIAENLGMLEDSMDGNPPSVNSDIATISSPAPSVSSTPLSSKLKVKPTKKSLTGYILYSSDVRRSICQSNPDASFGDISRIVGNEWKNLPASVKQNWEDKALRLNEESRREYDEMNNQNNSASPGPLDENRGIVFECKWDKCDFQFEEIADLTEHCLSESTGHIQRSVPPPIESEYTCLWRKCIRVRKNMQAFPTIVRLIKHVREVHLSKGGKVISTNERSKNFVLRKQKVTLATQGNSVQANAANSAIQSNSAISPRAIGTPENNAQTQAQVQVVGPPPEPMFVTVPPRPQRVLHSEAYIKYIEGLQSNSPYILPHKKSLKPVTPADVNISSRLPQIATQWLGDYNGQTNDVVQALCHLRNFMMDDVLQIQRNCY